MSAVSFATARLMETWAHGQDVVDALGVARGADGAAPPRRRPRRAHAPVQLRGATGSRYPDDDVRVELDGPDGDTWTWGESASDVVRGDALDFCLVVTKRRRPDDTALEVTGPLAREWIDIAQAFAGPPSK